MKRKTKNIISIGIIVSLIGLIIFTIYFAKNNISSDVELMFGDDGQIPSMNETMQNNTNETMEESPEKPDGEDFNSTMEKSNDNESMSEPPEKPDGEDSNSTIGKSNDNESMSEPPEKPDGEDSNSTMEKSNDNGTMGKTDGNNDSNGISMPGMNKMESKSLTMPYYVIIGIESLLLSLVVIYLIQSKFNKKTIKETYKLSDKILICILLSIISTTILTLGISYITNNYVLTTNSSSNDKISEKLNNNSNITYSAKTEIKESKTISDEKYESTSSDENALLVSGDIEVSADEITVTKTGDSDGGDNTSFYGINSAIIAKDGAQLTIKNATITTDATGANGVFSYGGSATTNNSSSDGTTVNISDSTITTKKDNSGGIMTTGGGITNATNLTIETSGTSSAAIRSDRGGGEVNVDGGTYKTTGQGSPSIYSTANISVKNAELVATASEGIVIEGKNTVSIENCKLTDTNNKLNGQSTTYKNIFLYQSMSGDASDGTSQFTAKDSTITTNKGDTLYITNTSAKITLTNNTIVNNDSTGNFLRAMADSWGNSGSNGGEVILTLNNQKVKGNIVIDSISTLDLTLKSSSKYEGTINSSNEAKNISLTLDKSSSIKLTGDSYVSSLDNADSKNSNIDFNGYKLYVNGKAIN